MSDSGDSKSYNAVPPPPSLSSAGPTVDFNDALSRVKAIAARLAKQNPTSVAVPAPPPAPAQGVKRSFDFGDDPSSRSQDDGEDRDRDAYTRNRSSASETSSHDGYGDYGREAKRNALDSGSSRPSYNAGGESRRFGLGSEERKAQSAYGSGVTQPAATIQQEFTVPNSLVGLVIGKGGENLKRIERTSGAKVQFSQDQPSTDPDRRVTVTGRHEDVKSAREMIQQALDDARAADLARRGSGPGLTASAAAVGRMTLTITIPSAKVGLVIGRGGETIRDLQDRSGAKIMVTPDNAAEKAAERTVNLVGEDDAIQRAKALIDEIVNADAGIDKVTPSRDWSAYRQPAPNDETGSQGSGGGGSAYGGSGGRGGELMRNSYGEPPRREERERVHNPMETRMERLERMEREGRQEPRQQHDFHAERGEYGQGERGGYGPRRSEESETIQVPNDSVGFIIGKGGETVRMLQDQSGAKIKVEQVRGGPPSAERNVFIYGKPPHDVDLNIGAHRAGSNLCRYMLRLRQMYGP
ncbi:hypothetical protein BC936DRAFT_145305 [Jimgerdemannia flammicorona]|uniref:Uncharacterized protein n=2 Tax=Jimgerdemannia flammicorona TaxID=994334 RepID=A0A433QRZ4_9FUNG|nr:hypothetical protein BC936DRAFT_145305 [Jimgerdemannia flammicorona]RUS32545.1 hypothetical protein BC938DRAFT_475107 [Jimgerdemannia flammicorona]